MPSRPAASLLWHGLLALPPVAALWAGLERHVFDNPVFVREIRSRMRGNRTYWLLFCYVGFLAAGLAFIYSSSTVDNFSPAGMAGYRAPGLGRAIYSFVFVAQALLLMAIGPGLTAGGITGEREQKCYELLVTTPLQGVDLVLGKLLGSAAFTVLVLSASLPLVSLVFLIGGVSPEEVLGSYLVILLSSILVASGGAYCSAALRTTAGATATAYVLVIVFLIATLFIPGLGYYLNPAGGNVSVLAALNPITAVWVSGQSEPFLGGTIPGWLSSAATLFCSVL
ncbi:MAG: hypothetical protein FJX77_16725, partial [Armatimonadetes bacterium]|nr:hypothetical protein [Armatimonadota bacterium]